MENDNGRSETPMTIEELQKENLKLKETATNLYNRCQQLESTWMLNRANFLFKILEISGFSEEIQTKAREELEGFLFPDNTEA